MATTFERGPLFGPVHTPASTAMLVWEDGSISASANALRNHLEMRAYGYADEEPVQVMVHYASKLREARVLHMRTEGPDADGFVVHHYDLAVGGLVVDHITVRVDGRA